MNSPLVISGKLAKSLTRADLSKKKLKLRLSSPRSQRIWETCKNVTSLYRTTTIIRKIDQVILIFECKTTSLVFPSKSFHQLRSLYYVNQSIHELINDPAYNSYNEIHNEIQYSNEFLKNISLFHGYAYTPSQKFTIQI